MRNNRNNVFYAYAYDGQGRYSYVLELRPFEDTGSLSYYVYHDADNMYVKYEYRILEILGDAFVCDFPDGTRILAVGSFEDVMIYEYDGSKHMSAISSISEILCRDEEGNIIYRYLFSEGYPVKTILQNGEEIFWSD